MEFEAFSSTSSQDLVECRNCGRNFNSDALRRHEPICAKSGAKKRKVFDSSKQRRTGTDIKPPKGGFRATQQASKEPPRKNNWRQKHEDFINSIRAARGAKQAMDRGEPLPPPPPPSINPDYIQCQYCGRRFNEKAHTRHEPFCRDQHSRLPNKKEISDTAKRRAQARSEYKPRVPKSSKTGSYSPGYSEHDGAAYSYQSQSTSYNRTPVRTTTQKSAGRYGASKQPSGRGDYDVDTGPGRALRTGRTAETYKEARQLSATQRAQHHVNSRFGETSPVTHTSPAAHTPAPRTTSGVAKFCHQCGTKYPVSSAKFCIECGVKRSLAM